jgi:hypothetical protein
MRARSHVCRVTLTCLLVGVGSLRLGAIAVPRPITPRSAAIAGAGFRGAIILCALYGGPSHAHQTPLVAAACDAALAQRLRRDTHVSPR